MDHPLAAQMRERLEADGDARVADHPQEADAYRARVADRSALAHVSIESHPPHTVRRALSGQAPPFAWSCASMNAFRNAIGDEIPAMGACGSPAPAMTRVPKLNIRPRIS